MYVLRFFSVFILIGLLYAISGTVLSQTVDIIEIDLMDLRQGDSAAAAPLQEAGLSDAEIRGLRDALSNLSLNP